MLSRRLAEVNATTPVDVGVTHSAAESFWSYMFLVVVLILGLCMCCAVCGIGAQLLGLWLLFDEHAAIGIQCHCAALHELLQWRCNRQGARIHCHRHKTHRRIARGQGDRTGATGVRAGRGACAPPAQASGQSIARKGLHLLRICVAVPRVVLGVRLHICGLRLDGGLLGAHLWRSQTACAAWSTRGARRRALVCSEFAHVLALLRAVALVLPSAVRAATTARRGIAHDRPGRSSGSRNACECAHGVEADAGS